VKLGLTLGYWGASHRRRHIRGMGGRDMNFHKQVFARMGYEREADRIQDLFLEGRRQEAVRAVPRSMAADISLVGPVARIRDELAMWEEAGVTMLVVGARGPREMRAVADAVIGA
jgi:Luciferase-like monooxygenase